MIVCYTFLIIMIDSTNISINTISEENSPEMALFKKIKKRLDTFIVMDIFFIILPFILAFIGVYITLYFSNSENFIGVLLINFILILFLGIPVLCIFVFVSNTFILIRSIQTKKVLQELAQKIDSEQIQKTRKNYSTLIIWNICLITLSVIVVLIWFLWLK